MDKTTTTTTQEKIAIMQAYVDGKTIQYDNNTGHMYGWTDLKTPNWNWDLCDYRIKPEPRKIYMYYGDSRCFHNIADIKYLYSHTFKLDNVTTFVAQA